MKLAVIGWGSLIWDPRELAMTGRWRKDGPELPVEFARRSNNGRLTLALHADSELQRTYWAVSGLTDLDAVRRNLQKREGALDLDAMHWLTRVDAHNANNQVVDNVRVWLDEHAAVDAVVWTGLRVTLDGDVVAKAVGYLAALDPKGTVFPKAREYVTKAPPQIQTRVRREMQQRGWTDATLPDELFE